MFKSISSVIRNFVSDTLGSREEDTDSGSDTDYQEAEEGGSGLAVDCNSQPETLPRRSPLPPVCSNVLDASDVNPSSSRVRSSSLEKLQQRIGTSSASPSQVNSKSRESFLTRNVHDLFGLVI